MLKTTLPKDAIKADGYVSLEAPAVLAGHSCPTNIYTGERGDRGVNHRRGHGCCPVSTSADGQCTPAHGAGKAQEGADECQSSFKNYAEEKGFQEAAPMQLLQQGAMRLFLSQ